MNEEQIIFQKMKEATSWLKANHERKLEVTDKETGTVVTIKYLSISKEWETQVSNAPADSIYSGGWSKRYKSPEATAKSLIDMYLYLDNKKLGSA